MWANFRKRLYFSSFSVPFHTHGLKNPKNSYKFVNFINNSTPFNYPLKNNRNFTDFSIFSSYTNVIRFYVTKIDENGENFENGENSKIDENSDFDEVNEENNSSNENFALEVDTILSILNDDKTSKLEAKNKLESCKMVTMSQELVCTVLSRVRNDWEKAFTFFLWAQNKPDYEHSLRAYHSMICILAKMRKFDTAWALINEMKGSNDRVSIVTPHTLMIMIRRYCAVHEVGKAINTFYAHKMFKFDVGLEEFHGLLSALCRYKNVKDAEHLLFCNENVFGFSTKSFNIVLNGWCNVVCNPREAKRTWREMEERGVARDVISYSCIISCFSKYGNLYEALKLFDQMNELNITLDRKVYNAVIHALAKKRLVKDACDLLKTMESNGIAPDAVSYNSLIMPLCKSGQLREAKDVFNKMLEHGVSPSERTYQAFFRILRSKEEVFSLLEKMNKMGLCPGNDTRVMLIRKFSRWGLLDDVLKLWSEMSKHGGPDRSAYVALIQGLFLNGKLKEAHKYYEEMNEKNYLPEPELDKLLQSCFPVKRNC